MSEELKNKKFIDIRVPLDLIYDEYGLNYQLSDDHKEVCKILKIMNEFEHDKFRSSKFASIHFDLENNWSSLDLEIYLNISGILGAINEFFNLLRLITKYEDKEHTKETGYDQAEYLRQKFYEFLKDNKVEEYVY